MEGGGVTALNKRTQFLSSWSQYSSALDVTLCPWKGKPWKKSLLRNPLGFLKPRGVQVTGPLGRICVSTKSPGEAASSRRGQGPDALIWGSTFYPKGKPRLHHPTSTLFPEQKPCLHYPHVPGTVGGAAVDLKCPVRGDSLLGARLTLETWASFRGDVGFLSVTSL